MIPNYRGTWGRYPWYPEHGYDLLHPDERQEDAWKRFGNTRLFCCLGETEDGYLILRSSDKHYRVKSDLYRLVPAPVFNFGDQVRDMELNRAGTVTHICWHYNHQREYYLLSINGRLSKKWNWAENLELMVKAE